MLIDLMLQKCLITILTLLVVWLASPHIACCCQVPIESMKTSLPSDTGCCCSESQGHSACQRSAGSEIGFSKDQPCCKSSPTVLAAFTLETVEISPSLISEPAFHGNWTSVPQSSQTKFAHNWRNRAPPRNVGMGSSLTYLYKRTLLI